MLESVTITTTFKAALLWCGGANNNINHQCYMSVPNGLAGGGGDAGHVQHLLFGETKVQGAWVNS